MFRFVALICLVAACSGFAIESEVDRSQFNRVVGGEEVDIEEIPHQILIQLDGSLYCGGTIISSTTILTAAHCLTSTVSRYSIRAGSTSQYTGGVVIPVTSIVRHPNYSSFTFNNDVGVMYLERPLEWSERIQPAVLADIGEEFEAGTIATASGWGDLASGSQRYPENLHKVDVPVVAPSVCRGAYSTLTDNMICAGVVTKDSCQGDSGGPLTINGKHAGIVSHGRGCGSPGYPGVYSKTAALRTWIDQNTRP